MNKFTSQALWMPMAAAALLAITPAVWAQALVDWVEKSDPPKQIIARGITVFPGRTRPLCPYPTYAQYKGQGNIEDAANFTCQ